LETYARYLLQLDGGGSIESQLTNSPPHFRRSAGRSLLGSRIGLQGLGCADQYQGPAILVFRRRLHLIARKIEDGVLPAQRKMEGIPIDRDLAVRF
jgi:hypothetical protein